jgi:hypothetical protein
MITLDSHAIASGLAAVAAFWLAPTLRGKPPWNLFLGTDGKSSTSKLQIFLWSSVVLFAYVAVFVQRCAAGPVAPVAAIPPNLMIAMGFSIATAATAKAITSGYVASGRLVKRAGGAGGLLVDDDGQTDLAKTQLVMWTVVGIAVYLWVLLHADPAKGLPDIDGALMVLMGLGQGAYIGKKLVTTDTPQLLTVTQQVRPGRRLVMRGASLGDSPGTVLFDQCELSGVALAWSDTEIAFDLPAAHPSGSPWADGQAVRASAVVAGKEVANPLTMTVALIPRPETVDPPKSRAGSDARVLGTALAGKVTLVEVEGSLAVLKVAEEKAVTFTVPAGVAPKKAARVLVTVDGNPARAPLEMEILP